MAGDDSIGVQAVVITTGAWSLVPNVGLHHAAHGASGHTR